MTRWMVLSVPVAGSLQRYYDIIIKLNAHSKSRANLEEIGKTHIGYSIKQKRDCLKIGLKNRFEAAPPYDWGSRYEIGQSHWELE
jgi:hypothetical protein